MFVHLITSLRRLTLSCILVAAFAGGCDSTRASGGGWAAASGINEQASFFIGAEGGSLQLQQVALLIPAGALEQETEITVTVRQLDTPGVDSLSAVYEFGPAGLQFQLPAELELTLQEANPEARLYRGESLSMSPVEVPGAKLQGNTLVASIDGFSYYLAGKPKSSDNDRPPSRGISFEIGGIRYSTSPVLKGDINGFAYSLEEGAGVNDGAAQSGHVWHGKKSCMTFRFDGTGVVDSKGGSNTRLYDFPWVTMELEPGSAVSPMLVGLDSEEHPAGKQVLAPDYDRASELHRFQWGVRLNDDGSLYTDSLGNYEYAMKYLDGDLAGTVDKARWAPETDAPASTPGHALYGYSTAEPKEQHFCMFHEVLTKNADDLGPMCLKTEVAESGLSPALTRKHCYAGGMLQGEYEVVRADGVPFQSGQFQDNRPVGGWAFHDKNTGKLRAKGTFSAAGVHDGKWDMYEAGVLSRTVPFAGALKLTEFGFYAAVLEGEYSEYDVAKTTLKLRGSLLENKKNGWWSNFDGEKLVATEEYDASTQIPDGASTCFKMKDGSSKCVKHTSSWLKQRKSFDWAKCSTSNTMTHFVYDQAGKVTSKTCYDIAPPYDAPKIGAERKCGSACKI